MKPAEYRGDRKIGGLRSSRTVKYRVTALVDHFGKMKLRTITLGEIERFKAKRLNTKTKSGKERSIAAVNRELEVLRAMLRYARNEGWIEFSPFERASTPLISKADEAKRDRILSHDEERLLLATCDNPVRQHLRPLIIAAVDTGMRKGELLSLTWKDIDFVSRTINVRALTTKTLTSRIVPISDRLFTELTRLYERFPDRSLVFGITTKFQHSWETACRIASLDDMHFHDLRATFCTRLIEAGMPIEQVAKLSGHTQLSTLYSHYLGTTNQAIQRATDILNQIHSRSSNDILSGDDCDRNFVN